MSRMIVTHAVKDVDQWLACRAKALEAFAPYATDIFFCTLPEGGHNVALSLNVHDMEGMMAMTQTPKHQAFSEEAGIIHDPAPVMYFEPAG
ncbi:MAG: hypothetical protein WAS33_22415 [Candidatus Promineifilaceae bacterium]